MTSDLILYQDADLVAINKPSGLLVHRTRIDRHESSFALQQVRDLLRRRVYPVHRLDKPTSGVLLFALHVGAARRIARAFAEGHVEKRYLAVVRGYSDDEGVIDHPLSRRDGPATPGEAPCRPARTSYRTLGRVELPFRVDRYPTSRYSLVEAMPRTGRTHQIRRHFKHIAHPIMGDRKYGKNRHNDLFVRLFGSRRLLLHAASIVFPHPAGGSCFILARPGEDMYGVMDALGWARYAAVRLEDHPRGRR